jgi:putative peptide zinc metalloprotease protein
VAAFGTAQEADQLLAEAPAFAGLSTEDRMGLAAAARPVSVAPGGTIQLRGPDEAIVIASGVVSTPDGQQLGRGTLIGPAGVADAGGVAVARSQARLFSLPAVSGLPLLLGTPVGALTAEAEGRAPGRPPTSGVHPKQSYPPLAVPPGPPVASDGEVDRRFEKKLRWLLILVLLLAFLFTGGNILMAPLAWGEMPSDQALVRVQVGDAVAVVGGVSYDLAVGDEIYVGQADDVKVGIRSRALVTYHGGASSILCAGTEVTMGHMVTAGEPPTPSADVTLRRGIALIDTKSTSPAFENLDSTVDLGSGVAANQGAAWYALAPWGVQVSEGRVTYGGALVPANKRSLGCGDGSVIQRPSVDPTPSPEPTPSPSDTPTPSPSVSPTAGPTIPTTTTSTTTKPPTTTTKPPTTQPPRDTTPPSIGRISATQGRVVAVNSDGQPCQTGPTTTDIVMDVTDPTDPPTSVTVTVTFSTLHNGLRVGMGSVTATFLKGTTYRATFPARAGGNQLLGYSNSVDAAVRATDKAKNTATGSLANAFIFVDCANG